MQQKHNAFAWLSLIAAFSFLSLGSASAQSSDYGDAPSSYDGSSPASHTVTSNLYIGADNVDAESGPYSSVDADGDNTHGNNDENGVSVLPTIYTESPNVAVTVNGVYNNTLDSALLVGWIDFNRNGVFDAGEQSDSTIIGPAAASSNIELRWNHLTTSMMSAGVSYLRIRLTTDRSGSWFTSPSPTGARSSGEVEDYEVSILALPPQKSALLDSLTATQWTPLLSYPSSSGHPSTAFDYMDAGVSSIIGGERDITQTASVSATSVYVLIGNGQMTINNDPASNNVTVITYDGADQSATLNPTGLGGIDLSRGSYFAMDYVQDVLYQPNSLTIKVYTDATHWSEYNEQLPVTGTTPLRLFFPFTSFATGTGATGPMDIKNVGAIQFIWDNNYGSDVQIFNVMVPEPKRDFGDAPAVYEVSPLGAASHLMTQNLKIGALIDTNSFALSSPHSDGDNLNALDDEDAVTEFPIITGNTTTFSITVHAVTNITGANAALVGWVDLNHDGDFNDPGERSNIKTVPSDLSGPNDYVLTWGGTGVNALTPAQIKSAMTTLRVRITSDNSYVNGLHWFTTPLPNGDRADGEVEDYEIKISQIDGGDVSGYPRAQAYVNPDENNDGQPDSVGSVWLGNIVDGELTDLANSTATGDDNNNMQDEDGVRVSIKPAVANQPITFWVYANHQGSNKDSAVIGFWIDWDGNGSFDDPDDFFATDKVYFTGAGKVYKAYTMTVPIGASVTGYVVRAGIYPLPNTTNIAYTKGYTFPGIQVQGEWEDYKNNIVLPLNLLSFDAQAAGNTSLLNWSMVKGSTLASTDVVRSSDGKTFSKIGNVKGVDGTTNYSFVDESPIDGANFYRITLNDVSGAEKQSSVKKVIFGKLAQAAIAQGTTGGMNLRLLNTTNNATYEVFSSKGQIVAQGSITGTSIKEVSGLIPGLYVVSFKDAQGNAIQNITVTVF
ncbi:MAG: T9SS type A sorting domain-containing protein [Chitinophagaceae bacterium]